VSGQTNSSHSIWHIIILRTPMVYPVYPTVTAAHVCIGINHEIITTYISPAVLFCFDLDIVDNYWKTVEMWLVNSVKLKTVKFDLCCGHTIKTLVELWRPTIYQMKSLPLKKKYKFMTHAHCKRSRVTVLSNVA